METPLPAPSPAPGLYPHHIREVFPSISPNFLPRSFGLWLSLSRGTRAEVLLPFCCFKVCSSPRSPGHRDPSMGAAPQRAGVSSSSGLHGEGTTRSSSLSPGTAAPRGHHSTIRTCSHPDSKVPSRVHQVPASALPRGDMEAFREQQVCRAAEPRQRQLPREVPARPAPAAPLCSTLREQKTPGRGTGSWAPGAAGSRLKALSSSSCHQGLGCAVRL